MQSLSFFLGKGLMINVLYSSVDTYEILELEESDRINSRNMEVLNAIPFKEDFIYYESDIYSLVDIVYALLSKEQTEKYANDEPIKIKVLVKIYDQNINCVISRNCIPDNASIKGLVQVGLDNLKNGDFEKFESDLITLDDNVILLDPDEKPIDWYWNLVMLIVGTAFGITILKSFFRRAPSFSEYWNKITEKE